MSTRSRISLLLLVAIHLVYLVMFVNADSTHVGIKTLALSLFVFLIVGSVYSSFDAPGKSKNHQKIETLLYPFVVAFAGVLCHYVSNEHHLGPVIASAAIGFIASYLPAIFKSEFLKSLPVPIYCGTFVGMCSGFLTEDYFFLAYAGLVAGVIYIVTRDAMHGIGGKLGTIAFGGVIVVSFIFSLI